MYTSPNSKAVIRVGISICVSLFICCIAGKDSEKFSPRNRCLFKFNVAKWNLRSQDDRRNTRKSNSSEEILKLLGGKSLFLPKFEMKLRKNEMKLRKKDFEVRKNLPFLPWKTRISSVESRIKWELAHKCRRVKKI